MSTILYYSNYCESCKKLLGMISRSPIKDEMHFICIDKRSRHSNGQTYVQLSDGQEVLLPPSITKVPALLLLNRGYKVLFGDEIANHIAPTVEAMKQNAVVQTGEPMAFGFSGSSSGGFANFGVASDNYSFLDQSSEDLAAKGSGGMRQQHHYASIQHVDKIETPPDNYEPDTIKGVSMEQIQQQREQAIKTANSK